MARVKQSTKDKKADVMDIGAELGLTVLGDSNWATVDDWLPTFMPELDKILGGGVPFGRLTEVMGKNQSGKSTLSIALLRNAIALDVIPILIDTEGTADPFRLADCGVDTSKVFLVQPEENRSGEISENDTLTVEYVAEKVQALIKAFSKTDKRVLIIWDSIAQTPATAEIEKGVANKQPGIKSKALSQFINIVAPMVSKSNCAFVAINQARDEMGSMFGGVESPGGHALKHWASVRLEVNKSTAIKSKIANGIPGAKETEEYIGHQLRIKTIKSKVTRPQQTSISFLINGDLDYEENIYYSAKDRFKLINATGWKRYVDEDGVEHKFQQHDAWVAFLKSPEGEQVRRELFQEMLVYCFPDGFAPMKNKAVDVMQWPDMKGIEDRYKNRQNKEVEATGDVDSVVAEL